MHDIRRESRLAQAGPQIGSAKNGHVRDAVTIDSSAVADEHFIWHYELKDRPVRRFNEFVQLGAKCEHLVKRYIPNFSAAR